MLMKKKYIYIYTTESFRAKSWYKVGESIRHPTKRIAEQDIASSPEPLEFIHSWVVNNSITDKTIHELLEINGYTRLRKNREWFELSNNPIEDVNSIIQSIGEVIVESDTEVNDVFKDYAIPDISELWWAKNPKEDIYV